MPEIFKSPAFVISSRDFGESDRIITFYTMDRGKLWGIAKGAKRSRRRFLNALEPFTLLDLSLALHRTSGLNRIDSVKIIENFSSLRHKIDCYVMASLCCELLNLWTRENDPQEGLFRLLQWCFNSLNEGRHPKKTVLFFKIHLLAMAGYKPDFERCLLCKKQPKGDYVVFKLYAGGFICSKCQTSVKKTHNNISLGTLKSLRYIQKGSVDELYKLTMTDEILKEAWSLMKNLHFRYLEQMPASYKVLASFDKEIYNKLNLEPFCQDAQFTSY